jgi:hypothetical protein
MVAAVAIANTVFFMFEAFQFPELQPAGQAMVSRKHHCERPAVKFNIDERPAWSACLTSDPHAFASWFKPGLPPGARTPLPPSADIGLGGRQLAKLLNAAADRFIGTNPSPLHRGMRSVLHFDPML